MAVGVGVAVGSGEKAVPVRAAATTTISKSSSDLMTENGWTASSGSDIGTKFSSVALDQNITVAFSGTGNTATYWSNGNDIRIYGTKGKSDASITFSGADGVTIQTVTLTYTLSNSPSFTPTITSGNALSVNGNSQVITMTSADKNGQIKITNFSVTYSGGEASTNPSLSDITCNSQSLKVGDSTGLTLSVTPTNPGDNKVSWASNPSEGVSLTPDADGNSANVKFTSGSGSLAGGTAVTITASLTGATSKTYTIYAIEHAGSESDPFNAIEAKYFVLDGGTGTHYVAAYIASISGQNNNNYWLSDDSEATKGDFELFGGVTNNTGVELTAHRFILAHGTFTKYNTTAEATGSVIDRVDYVALEKASLEVNYGKTVALSVTSAGGNVTWSTTGGEGSVSLSNQSNTGVTITGTGIGTATVTATVGTYSQNCNITVLEYAEDWTFKSITLTTGTGFVSTYEKGDSFINTGITVTYVEHSDTLNKDRSFDRTSESTFNFDDNKNTIGEFNLTATYNGHTTTDEAKITITAKPGRIYFGNYTVSNGYMKITSSSKTGKDNFGNDVEVITDATSFTNNGGATPNTQIGSSSDKGNEVLIKITLSDRAGLESLSVNFASSTSCNTDMVAYTDNDELNNVISGSASNGTLKVVSTDSTYETMNASIICVKFTPTQGIKIASITYTLGNTVAEFENFSTLEIKTEAINKEFKVGQTFNITGLVLTATDTVNNISKDYISGFTTNFDSYKTNAFQESDVGNNKTVVVTLTIGEVEKTVQYTISIVNPPKYSAASSLDLYEGSKVIIVCSDSEAEILAAAGAINGDYLSSVDGTLDGEYIAFNSNFVEFTIEYYGSDILLKSNGKYLRHNGDKKVAFSDTIMDGCSWTYDGNEIINADHSSYSLQYNSGNPRFTDYSSSQKAATLYVSSLSQPTDTMKAETFAQKYLHMRDYLGTKGEDGDNYCLESGKNYFAIAAEAYTSLTAEVKTEFKKLTDAVERFEAWAAACGKTINLDTGAVTAKGLYSPIAIESSDESSLAIVIISVISITAIGGFFFIRRKKEN